MKLEELFVDKQVNFGVWRLGSSVELIRLRNLAEKKQFASFVIDGNEVKNKQGFLKKFVETFKSPHDVSKSWDYFQRLLEFLEWIDAKGTVLVYKDFQHFLEESKEDFDILFDIFKTVVKFRESRSHFPEITPLYIFLQGNDTIELDVEWISD